MTLETEEEVKTKEEAKAKARTKTKAKGKEIKTSKGSFLPFSLSCLHCLLPLLAVVVVLLCASVLCCCCCSPCDDGNMQTSRHEMEDQSSEQESYSQEWYEDQKVWHEDSSPGGTERHESQWDLHDSNSTSWETANEWMSTASSSQQTAQNTGGSIQILGSLDLCAVEKWDGNTMKPISVRTDQSNRTITFGVDTAACRTVVHSNHPAARGYRVHLDSGAGVPNATAGKSVVWDGCWWPSKRRENLL